MKVQELIDVMGMNKNKILKADQLKELLIKTLEIKKYISIKDKKNIVDDIVSSCILYENGVFKFNEIDKYIYFTMKTIKAYTNLELSDDIEEDYDLLCENKLLNIIISTFKAEYDEVSVLLQMKCDYVLSSNNLEEQVGKFLTGLLEKVDDFSSILGDKINNFDFNKLPINKSDLVKLLNFVDNYQKK